MTVLKSPPFVAIWAVTSTAPPATRLTPSLLLVEVIAAPRWYRIDGVEASARITPAVLAIGLLTLMLPASSSSTAC